MTASGTSLAQGLFDDCSKNIFRLSKPESWQRDSTQSRTFIRNCHTSTTYLVLYTDSTFQFKVDRCGTGGYAEGNWKLDSKKRIVLGTVGNLIGNFISIHGHNFSLTYTIENVDNETFRTKGTDLIKVTR